MSQDSALDEIRVLLRSARDGGRPLSLVGGGTKAFYGRAVEGQVMELAGYQGIVAYEPTELVVTARCGTRLRDLEAALAANAQMLACEPPRFGLAATLGGAVACGLSGPRRPYAGSLRDFVLGIRLLDGQDRLLSFGGQVMKNVAGFDLARLMVGSLGTLGIILEVSLKVLPRPEEELTLRQQLALESAIAGMNRWAAQPLPLSGAAYVAGELFLRLSGSAAAVAAARDRIGGDAVADGGGFWDSLREQRLPFFEGESPLWRLSVPPAAPPLELPGTWLLDWGGAQRWLRSGAAAEAVFAAARSAGGHASLFRGGDRNGEVFSSLEPGLESLHRRLKQTLDPQGILNPGRLYKAL